MTAKKSQSRESRLIDDAGLRPAELLSLEALRTSAEVITCAQRGGYLDRHLFRTPKPVRCMRGRVSGFQSGLVQCEEDIIEEVRFWRSDRPLECAGNLGVYVETSAELLKMFEAEDGGGKKVKQRRFRDGAIEINPEALDVFGQLPRAAVLAYIALSLKPSRKSLKAKMGKRQANRAIKMLSDEGLIDSDGEMIRLLV